MSLKDDLMYPFGNPFKERVQRDETITALNNVLKLAKDKLRAASGEMEEILLSGRGGSSADDEIAKQSVELVEELLSYIDAKEENNT
jgi:hypothetical protein